MRPARMKSRWAKILPWYYDEKKDPGRWNEKRRSFNEEEFFKLTNVETHAQIETDEI